MSLQEKVYELAAQGFSAREIGRGLNANEKTVYYYLLKLEKSGHLVKDIYEPGYQKQATYKATAKNLKEKDHLKIVIPHFSFFNDPFNLAGMR